MEQIEQGHTLQGSLDDQRRRLDSFSLEERGKILAQFQEERDLMSFRLTLASTDAEKHQIQAECKANLDRIRDLAAATTDARKDQIQAEFELKLNRIRDLAEATTDAEKHQIQAEFKANLDRIRLEHNRSRIASRAHNGMFCSNFSKLVFTNVAFFVCSRLEFTSR